MKLITTINRCHRFRGFVHQHARFSADKNGIVAVEEVPWADGKRTLTKASCSFDDWCRQVMRSRIEPMKKIARSIASTAN